MVMLERQSSSTARAAGATDAAGTASAAGAVGAAVAATAAAARNCAVHVVVGHVQQAACRSNVPSGSIAV